MSSDCTSRFLTADQAFNLTVKHIEERKSRERVYREEILQRLLITIENETVKGNFSYVWSSSNIDSQSTSSVIDSLKQLGYRIIPYGATCSTIYWDKPQYQKEDKP